MSRRLEIAFAPAGPGPSPIDPRVDPRAFAVMEAVARIMGGLVLAVGLLVLAGWWFDAPVLKSIRPTFASMKANTATAFVLSGLALLVFRRNQPRPPRWLTVWIPAAVTTIGALTLAESVLGVNLRIDQILFREVATVAGSPAAPGRMATTSALAFVLIGVALLLTRRRTSASARIAQILTVVAMLYSFVSFVGYLYGGNTREFAAHTHLAPHTLAAFLLLGVGVVASSPQVGLGRLLASPAAGGLLLRRMLPFSLVVPVALGGLRRWGEHAGLYDTDLGLALFATARVAVICALLVWVAGDLTAEHERRLLAEAGLRDAKDALEVRVLERTLELARATQALQELAHRDPLTGLLNRRGGSEVITRELERARRKTIPIAVLLIDVDHFKRVNDSHGHHTGDLVLQAVARAVTLALRPYDIIVRWGGEEILVMAPDANAAGAAVIAERLRAAVEAIQVATLPPVTVSIGIAQIAFDEHAVAAAVSRADAKMYEAKRSGRNCAR